MENDKLKSAEGLRIKFANEIGFKGIFGIDQMGCKYAIWLENFIINQSSGEALTLADNEAKEKHCHHPHKGILYCDKNCIHCPDWHE